MGMVKRGSARKALRSSRTAATGTIRASRAIVAPSSGDPGSRKPSGLYESSLDSPLAAVDPGGRDSAAAEVRRVAKTAVEVASAVAAGEPVRGGSESMEWEEGPASRSSVRWALRPIRMLNLEAASAWLVGRNVPQSDGDRLQYAISGNFLPKPMTGRSGGRTGLLQLIALAAELRRGLIQSLQAVSDGLKFLEDRAEQLLGGCGG
ncbi:hypothetical protein BBFGKLBO_02282 [Synechococcus sp. CBW1107]|nr:hypothetical protein BBFGKLBO_02282 [Synechococcus sp. CBW1107]